jgi:hypothetical protein
MKGSQVRVLSPAPKRSPWETKGFLYYGSIGNNVLIGDFSNNQGDINSDLVINPELALSKDELDDMESINVLPPVYN